MPVRELRAVRLPLLLCLNARLSYDPLGLESDVYHISPVWESKKSHIPFGNLFSS